MMPMTCNFSSNCRLVSFKELLFYGSCQVRSGQAEHPLVPLCSRALKRTSLLLQQRLCSSPLQSLTSALVLSAGLQKQYWW